MDFSYNTRKIHARGMSQKEFSRATGITQSTVSDWRKKNTNPAYDKMVDGKILTSFDKYVTFILI